MDKLSQKISKQIDATSGALEKMIPEFDMTPDISDDRQMRAWMGLDDAAFQRLNQQFGYREVMKARQDFFRWRK